ncbi:BadF/BadG/BcrA/BcrD ATPase family protein (plasmid) [Deinococcus radiomollis]|uniref:N-acetylglucosamine kinase n=1 Tax=Deinococcus radiomollis TaxID=468916 RepID=UPI0038925230
MTAETVTKALLGIDGGGSGTKWAIFGPNGQPLRQGRLEALTGHLFTDEDRAGARTLLIRLAEVMQVNSSSLGAVVAGISGLQQGADVWFQDALADAFGLPPDLVRVTDDVTLAYAAQFSPGEGVLVYAGTGSIGYFQSADGEVCRAGGHGFLLGDEGGAFWQGQQGLKTALYTQDRGQEPTGPLAEELRAAVGSLDWPHLRQWVYGGGRAALATLAPAVYRAALAGDPDAQDVTRQAGETLAQLADTLLGRSPPGLPVTLAGGAANSLVRAAFTAALARLRPGAVQVEPRPPVLGAPKLSPLSRPQTTPISTLPVQPSEEEQPA